MQSRLKKIPKLPTEAAERAFWESHDSTPFIDWSQAQAVSLPNLQPAKRAPKKNFAPPASR